ncbi:MAG: N-acetyltransferase [Planctomycetales bacterium]|nr:N-acetyltransferase [Planctomycetales bacterium]
MQDVYIHPAAIVETDQIGAGSRIWAHAHLLGGATVGANCNLGDGVFLEGGAIVGNNVTLKNHVCVWDGVVIEDDVFVGPCVAFTNDRYPRSPRMPSVAQRYAEKENWLECTMVRRGVTIGANATILPGVELGAYCVVAAGAVVTRNVAPFALVAGTPARETGSVCRCGRPLGGSFRELECLCCGETPQQRLDLLQPNEVSPS